MTMEFSSIREKYLYHFISKYVDCVVVSFLHILMIFNISVIKRTKLFSEGELFHIYFHCADKCIYIRNCWLAAVHLMSYFDQKGVIILKVYGLFLSFCCCCCCQSVSTFCVDSCFHQSPQQTGRIGSQYLVLKKSVRNLIIIFQVFIFSWCRKVIFMENNDNDSNTTRHDANVFSS